MPDEETPGVETPELVPESADNLAYHVGELKSSHEAMRSEWAAHREEMGELKGLVNTLLEALSDVEDVAQEIATEEDVQEAAQVAEPVSGGSDGERKPHFIVRALRGH